jgi:hypothetical protein
MVNWVWADFLSKVKNIIILLHKKFEKNPVHGLGDMMKNTFVAKLLLQEISQCACNSL